MLNNSIAENNSNQNGPEISVSEIDGNISAEQPVGSSFNVNDDVQPNDNSPNDDGAESDDSLIYVNTYTVNINHG